LENDIKDIPRSRLYKDKTIEVEGFSTVKGTLYFKRVFTDKSAELIRYDQTIGKWVILCFLAKPQNSN